MKYVRLKISIIIKADFDEIFGKLPKLWSDSSLKFRVIRKSWNGRVSRITRQLNSEGFFDFLKLIRLTSRYRE